MWGGWQQCSWYTIIPLSSSLFRSFREVVAPPWSSPLAAVGGQRSTYEEELLVTEKLTRKTGFGREAISLDIILQLVVLPGRKPSLNQTLWPNTVYTDFNST